MAYISNSFYISTIASAFGVYFLGRWLLQILKIRKSLTSILQIGAVFLCFYQNVSWLLTSFINQIILGRSIESVLINLFGNISLTISGYALAIIFIHLFSLVLSILGNNKKIIRWEQELSEEIYRSVDRHRKLIVMIGLLVAIAEFLLFYKGIIGQRSVLLEGYENGEQSPLIEILFSLLPFQGLALGYLLSSKMQKNVWVWIALIFCLCVYVGISFTKGRRELAFVFINIFTWFCFFNRDTPKFFRIFICLIFFYPVLSKLFLFSNFLRGVNGYNNLQEYSSIELLPTAWNKFTSSNSLIGEEENATTENLSERPLVAIPLAMCINYPPESKSFTLGENLRNSFIWSMPRPIFPNKEKYPIQEDLLYKHFPVYNKVDTSDSVYLVAYTEFSWLGLLIYPCLIFFMWYTALFLLKQSRVFFLFKFISISIFFQLFILNMGEGSLTTWFSTLRSFVFWIILSHILSSLRITRHKTLA